MFKSISFKSGFIFLLVSAAESAGVVYLYTGGLNLNDNLVVSALIGGVLIGFILNILLVEFFVNYRLRNLSNEIKKLTSGKSYHRIKTNSEDELGVASRFFNEMTRQIERIALDLQTAERLSGEIGLAAKIQEDVLPKKAPVIPGIEMVAKTRSAAEMGGDSFDFLQSEGQTMFYIGDVTGHGVPAGLVMMMVNILIRAFFPLYNRSDQIVKKVNEVLYPRIATSMFMTSTLMRWHHNDKKMFFTGCGHEYILHYKAKEQKCNLVKSGGIALGMIPSMENIAKETEIDFELDDIIVLYSDGVTEAKGPNGEMFEVDRLKIALEKYAKHATAESVFDNITNDFADFVGKYEDQADDVTLMVLKNRGTSYVQQSVNLVVNNPAKIEGEKWSW